MPTKEFSTRSRILPQARRFGLVGYQATWQNMREFTDLRTSESRDEIWFLQHPSVYTLGQAGLHEHILAAGDIPVVESDRGGQVTYHGPGQLIAYTLIDLRRAGIGVRDLVVLLEQVIIDLLADYGVAGTGNREAPGVYVGARKIASLGLRIRKGCSYHGLALNIDVDLEPFSRINPCGIQGLEVTSMAQLGIKADSLEVSGKLWEHFARLLT